MGIYMSETNNIPWNYFPSKDLRVELFNTLSNPNSDTNYIKINTATKKIADCEFMDEIKLSLMKYFANHTKFSQISECKFSDSNNMIHMSINQPSRTHQDNWLLRLDKFDPSMLIKIINIEFDFQKKNNKVVTLENLHENINIFSNLNNDFITYKAVSFDGIKNTGLLASFETLELENCPNMKVSITYQKNGLDTKNIKLLENEVIKLHSLPNSKAIENIIQEMNLFDFDSDQDIDFDDYTQLIMKNEVFLNKILVHREFLERFIENFKDSDKELSLKLTEEDKKQIKENLDKPIEFYEKQRKEMAEKAKKSS